MSLGFIFRRHPQEAEVWSPSNMHVELPNQGVQDSSFEKIELVGEALIFLAIGAHLDSASFLQRLDSWAVFFTNKTKHSTNPNCCVVLYCSFDQVFFATIPSKTMASNVLWEGVKATAGMVGQAALDTTKKGKLQTELVLLNRETEGRKRRFGVELYEYVVRVCFDCME